MHEGMEPCPLCGGEVEKNENVCADCIAICTDLKDHLIKSAMASCTAGVNIPPPTRMVAILTKMNIQFKVFDQVELIQSTGGDGG